LPPLYGWCKKGLKLIVNDSKTLKSKKYSLLCAINNKKIIAYKLYEGSINKFLERYIYKEEYLNYKLLLDKIHHANIVKDNDKKTIPFIYNIPYSPELNPIEKVFSILKSNIRKNYFKIGKNLLKLQIDEIFNKINSTKNLLDSFYNNSLGY